DIALQGELEGLSDELLRLLRQADGAVTALDPSPDDALDAKEGEDEQGEDRSSSEDEERPRRQEEVLEKLDQRPVSRASDWSWVELWTDEPAVSGIRLAPVLLPTFVEQLVGAVPPRFWRCGGWLCIDHPEPFSQLVPPRREWPFRSELLQAPDEGLGD